MLNLILRLPPDIDIRFQNKASGLDIFDQLGTLQAKMIVYQGPIYKEQPTLSDQTLLCREQTKIGHIFSK